MNKNQEHPKYITTITKTKGYGWKAKTLVQNLNGYDWNIATLKHNSGMIICNAQAGKLEDHNGYDTFSFIVFQDPSISLYTEKRRATENAIQEIHELGLEKFTQRLTAGTIPSRDENK